MWPHPRNGTMPGASASDDPAHALETAKAELEQIRWTLRQTQRLTRVGSWERDLDTGETHWSEEMFRIHGLVSGEVQVSNELICGLVHPDDSGLRERWLEQIAGSPGTEFEVTMRICRPDGEVRTVRARGTLLLEENGITRRMIGTLQDITEETRGRHTQVVLAQIVQSATEAIITVGSDKAIRSWNPAAEKLYGYTSKEITGRHVDILLPAELSDEERQVSAARQQRLLAGSGDREEYQEARRHKDGTVIEIHGRSTPLRDHEGKIIGVVANHRDITDRRRAEERVAHLADHDALTGLFNRYRFEEELAAASAGAEHEGHEASVLELDLDNFSYINDAHGREIGDQLVQGLAEVLRTTVRPSDVLARIGGDSFGVLSARCDAEQAASLAEQLLDAVRGHALKLEERSVSVTASIGAVNFGGATGADHVTAAELMADADRALNESKESGRDRVTVHSTASRAGAHELRRSASERLIRDALRHDSFELYAQPIVRLSTGMMSHVEILIRLRRDGRLLPPSEFLPDAERQGLVHLIDYWVISRAFRVAAQHPDLTFDINLSGATIDDERLESFIAQELRRSGVDPRRIVFELTETEAVGNIGRARDLAQSLNELGCRFSLDDFGSGFSTFYYLKHFPADFLKIDGEFINDPRNRTDQLVIRSIVQLADALGKETIAEHVSDARTLERVRRLGVDFGQGYHFARPLSVADLGAVPRLLTPPSEHRPPEFTDAPQPGLSDPERLSAAGA